MVLCLWHVSHEFGSKSVITRIQRLRLLDSSSYIQKCHENDGLCLANHTEELLFQFRALPTILHLKRTLEISRLEAHMDRPFSVIYKIDRSNKDKFVIEQKGKQGVVKLAAPLRGPTVEVVRVHINTYSRTHVLLAHNLATITIYVSSFTF